MDQVSTKTPGGLEEKPKTEGNQDRVLRGADHHDRLKRECDDLRREIASKQKAVLNVEIHNWLFWLVVATFASIVIFLFSISILFFVHGSNINLFWIITLRHIGFAGIVAIPTYVALTSVGEVSVDDWGGLTFFGRPVRIFSVPGPVLRILGLLKLVKEPRGIYQEQYPGQAEKTVRFSGSNGSTTERYGEGEVRPVFVNTGPPTEAEREVLKLLIKEGLAEEATVLYRPFTVDISWFIHWRVIRPFEYERAILGNGPEERKSQVRTLLRQTCEEELKEIFRQLTPGTVIQCWRIIGERLKLQIEKISVGWGVEIVEAGLSEQNLSHGTHLVQAEAIRAAFEKISINRKAEAEQYKLAQEGAGRGQAIRSEGQAKADADAAMFKARAEGYAKIAKELGLEDKTVTFLADIAEKIAKGSNYSVYGSGGIIDLMAAVSALKAVPAAAKPASDTTKPETKEIKKTA